MRDKKSRIETISEFVMTLLILGYGIYALATNHFVIYDRYGHREINFYDNAVIGLILSTIFVVVSFLSGFVSRNARGSLKIKTNKVARVTKWLAIVLFVATLLMERFLMHDYSITY